MLSVCSGLREARIDMALPLPPQNLKSVAKLHSNQYCECVFFFFLLAGPSFKKTSWFQLNYLIKERMNKTWVTENEWVKELSFSVVCNPCESNFFCSPALHSPHSSARPNSKHKSLTPPPLNTLTHTHTTHTCSDKSTHHALLQSCVRVLMNIDFLLVLMVK